MRWFAAILTGILFASPAAAQQSNLKLLISAEDSKVSAPNPVRLTLHFHNAGTKPVWLYTPVRDESVPSEASNPFATEDFGPSLTSGGSTLEVRLKPQDASPDGTAQSTALGKAFDPVMPAHAKLISIPPGEDFEEKMMVRVVPPLTRDAASSSPPRWGRYALMAIYRAQYSNAQNLSRILDADIWEGEVASNPIEIEISPPAKDAEGVIEGTVLGSDMRPALGSIVSVSDRQERPVAQSGVDDDGKFKFENLSPGFYWVTARRRSSPENRSVFRHIELNAEIRDADLELVLLSEEIHDAKRLRHKPILIKVFDANEAPMSGMRLEATWSSGTVLDKVKGETGPDGAAALELIPGRNYVTVRRKGCPMQDERLDVAPGSGIDGFKIVFECSKH